MPKVHGKNRIVCVRIETKTDESPDSSYLGEYCSQPEGISVNRKTGEVVHCGHVLADGFPAKFSRDSFEFIGSFQYTFKDFDGVSDTDTHKAFLRCRLDGNGCELGRTNKNLFAFFGVKGWETAITKEQKAQCLTVLYCCLDAYRLERLNDGDWNFVGIIAKAVVSSGSGNLSQTLRSGGLWGVESDCGKEYRAEIAADQLAELRKELEAFGFGMRAINYAFENVIHD